MPADDREFSSGEASPLSWRDGELWIEGVCVNDIAERFDTPCYVYSRAAIESRWREYDEALSGVDHLVCFAVKANSNLAVLNVLARLGSGFDIVSIGELERVLAAGALPEKVVFSGVGKLESEIEQALARGVHGFNVESASELTRISQIAGKMGLRARISIRVNPDVDAKTHPYISTGLEENKFGIPIAEAEAIYVQASRDANLDVRGVDCHIGSQLTSVGPLGDAIDRLLALIDRLRTGGVVLEELDVGGGLGITYDEEVPPTPNDYMALVLQKIEGRGLKLLVEPGRSICGNAGLLLTRVQYLKRNGARDFAVVDAAMNDFIRPALYSGWSRIVATQSAGPETPTAVYDVVGPVCESADFLGKERELAIEEGDCLAVLSAGAYGYVMSSNYNSRPRPPEIMVDGDAMTLVRRRETVQELFAHESVLA
jgi:diaminopimelate decarboxylase